MAHDCAEQPTQRPAAAAAAAAAIRVGPPPAPAAEGADAPARGAFARGAAPRVRAGARVWLWQDVDGWVPATVERVEDARAADPRVALRTEGAHVYGGAAEEVVRLRGEDTVVLGRAPGDAPPAHFPASLLPPPVRLDAAQRAAAFPRGAAAARRAARERAPLRYGEDFAAAHVGGGQLGLVALRDLPAGARAARYGGDVRGKADFAHTRLYAGPRAEFLNRGTHAVAVPGTPYVLDGFRLAARARRLLRAGAPLPAELGERAAALANSSVRDAAARAPNCRPEWVDGELWLATRGPVAAGAELLWDYRWGGAAAAADAAAGGRGARGVANRPAKRKR